MNKKKYLLYVTKQWHLIMLFLFFLLIYSNSGFCIDISDDPMDTKVQSAPPNIMFILDNSGSMDWEFMTPENNGVFSNNEYLYPNPGDNNYTSGSLSDILANKGLWKSQWSGYNKIFYNPHSIYTAWPSTSTYTMDNADLKAPYSNPIHISSGDPLITLKDTYHTMTYATPIIVDNIDGSPAFTTAGTWAESSFENEWPYPGATHSSFFTNGNGTAVFKPDIPATGEFKVYAWWNCYTDRDTNAKITINYDGGSTSFRKNQRPSSVTNNEPGVCGEWIYLGDYNFNADDSGSVVIERDGSSTGGSTIADAVQFISTATTDDNILIKNAHYYTWYDEDGDGAVDNLEVYLVTWEDTDADDILDHRLYYQVNDTDGDNDVESLELRPLAYDKDHQGTDEVPNAIQPKNYEEDGVNFTYKTDEEDLQNFANWYSYYRRRELAAKAAVAKSIVDLDWVYAGFYTINAGVRQPVLPINVESNAIIIDNKDSGFTKSGTWNESSAQNYGQEYADSSLYSYTGTATWTPYLSAGTYKVYAYWGYAGSRTTQAQYTINHSGGTPTITKDHSIQTDAFNQGTSGSVSVHNIGSSSKCASADAIKFEKTSGGITVDDTDILLDSLYQINSDGGTPLRNSLRDVGRYYDQDDGYTGNLGTSPFKDEASGGACQQAFTILMTDGYYNGSDPGLGNEDGNDGAPYADIYSDTLADMAMKYYDTDLSSTLPDNLPTNNYDDKKTQHMVTYSVSFGVTGTIDPTDMDNDGITDNPTYEDDPYFLNSSTPKPTWPNPDAGDSQKIDDLWHTAVNGRGEFFSAEDPEELVSSLKSVFENLASRIASGASVSVNGDELNTGSVMYQSTYTSGEWEGDVTAFPIDPVTGEIKTEEGEILWHASDKLQSQDWDTGRRIVTYNGYDSITSFRYDTLTTLQKTSIGNNPDVVDYIRGKEVTGFRSRQKKLGDIVHSAPLLVIGDGMDNDTDSYIDEDGEESGLLFTGGNDGMLHAFDAQTGNEVFAYIPHIVFDHLSDLTAIDYDHKFYVDATPFSRTITVNGDQIVILTSGLKKGGKGYFCLDITKILYQNNASFSEDELATPAHNDGINVLWEYPQLTTAGASFASDDDLGYSFSDIFIAESYKINNTPNNHDWVAIFGNGYDSVNGSAVLYILNAYTGEVIKKIDTGVTGNNGLSSPALIDIDNDGKVDYVYAGDLLGNMWKFDLTSDDPANWAVAYTNTDASPAPLFSSPNQPITSAPDVMNHCAKDYGYMVLFGTGKFIAESDRTNIDKQTLYGIWDTGFPLGQWNEAVGTLSKMTGGTLLEQTQIDFRYLFNHYLRTLSDNEADWVDVNTAGLITSGTHIGWYFDLPMDRDNNLILDGERVIKDVMIRDRHLVAITFTPSDSPCTGGGTSMVHEMDACDGSRLDSPQFDINMDGVINKNDMISITDPNDSTKTILVAPTGKGYDGLLHPPIIVKMPGQQVEMKIFSSSAGTTERLFEKSEGGFYYWREIKN